MEVDMKKIAVLTSGGDAPGMNAAIRAVVRYGIYYNMEVYGIKRGYEGLIDGDIERLYRRSVGDILQRGGTILKTARSKRFMTEEGQAQAYKTLRDLKIEDLIVIGGNGSLAGAKALSDRFGVDVIGIPGTIDNDLSYTSMTLGYDTAVNVCVDAVRAIRATSRSHDRPHVVEVMGRHCGDIALMTATATGSEIVICPEAGRWSVQDIAKRLQIHIDRGNYRSTIVIAEGAWDKMRPFDVYDFLAPYGKEVYKGEPMTAYRFASVMKRLCKMPDGTFPEVRHTVVGYTQRGARPSARDAAFATEAGIMAVELLKGGVSNRVIGRQKGVVFHEDIDKAMHARRRFNRKLYDTLNSL